MIDKAIELGINFIDMNISNSYFRSNYGLYFKGQAR